MRSEATAARTSIDVAQFPPYPFEEDVIFLALSTTVSADSTGAKYVEVGVATLDTSRLAHQQLPPGHDGGHWAEKIEFTTFIAHPTATSYAHDLEIGPHIPDWVLGCTRNSLASWLEKVWQRSEEPQVSALPPHLRRNIVVITRSKEKLQDDLGQLGFELAQHYAILDAFSITDVYRQYLTAQPLGDTNIPKSFRAIREALRINEPIRQEQDKRSPSARTAHAILQAAIRCAVNDACLPGQRVPEGAGMFARRGVVALNEQEALTRVLSIRTTYTLSEIQSRVAETLPSTVQHPNGGSISSLSSSHLGPLVVSTTEAQPEVRQENAQAIFANPELDVIAASTSRPSPGSTSHLLAKSRQLLQDIRRPGTDRIGPDTDCPSQPAQPQSNASELPENVKLDIRAYHRATAAVVREIAYIARPYCNISEYWSLDDVSDRITTERLLALSTTIRRVAHTIRDNISQLNNHQLRRDLDSCISNRTRACKYYASRLGNSDTAMQNDRQQEAVCFLQEIHGVLFTEELQRNITPISPGQDVDNVAVPQSIQSSGDASDPRSDTQPSPYSHGPNTPKSSCEDEPSPPKAVQQPPSASSTSCSASEDLVLTPPSSLDGEAATSSISTLQPSRRAPEITTQDVIYIDEPRKASFPRPSGKFRSENARKRCVEEYQRDTRWFTWTLVELSKRHFDGEADHGSIESFQQTRRGSFGFYRCLAKIVRYKYARCLDLGKDFSNMRAQLDSAILGRQEIRAWHERQGQADESHVAFLELLMELKDILEGRSSGRRLCHWGDAMRGVYEPSESDWESMDED
ncbi:hypothetical protein HII31_08443 [Pseudocercospora fuligena]|uniref:Uncharacterized protein n=1 Tax=Pseudocercospora fuligena TaxID=685502 RepID=A0A8H6RG40_9PEZI|nr:hypothetical protein HII31_08443 [Pseudocercospora fuligena]